LSLIACVRRLLESIFGTEVAKAMVTREDVVAEIQKVPEKHLDEIYRIIKNYEEDGEPSDTGEGVMAKLRQIKISASPDLSTNANLYDLEEQDAG
jgi:hypothetical protein